MGEEELKNFVENDSGMGCENLGIIKWNENSK